MKRKALMLSALATLISGVVHASDSGSDTGATTGIGFEYLSTYKKILDDKRVELPENEIIEEDNPEYDGLEVQVTYHQPVVPALHGNFITKLETEIEYDEEGDATWSKVKYVLGEGTIRPKSWGNWFVFYHLAREDFFEGKPYSKQFTDGRDNGNSIMEMQPHYIQPTDWGHWGINVGLSHESLNGGLLKPRIRPFGSYRISDDFEVFTSWMFFKEMFYKEGNTDKNILETDSALIYHFDGGNIAMGYFAKFGTNIDDDGSREYDNDGSPREFGEFQELIWKPRMHYRFDNGLGVTLFGEFGKYKDETKHVASGQTYDLYEEWFRKYGVFAEYPLRDDLILFGEANYREGRIKETYTGTSYYETRDRNHNFAMIGLNFLF
ncbi:TPA: OmpG porin family protein [Vibrio vulnificus]